MLGVILDLASLGPAECDLRPLLETLEQWQLHDATAAGEVAARIAGAEVVLSNKVPLDAVALASAPRLALVVVLATGTNNVDLDAARRRGVVVCNLRRYAAPSVAEHTLLLMLALARSLPGYLGSVASGDWSRSAFFCLHAHPLVELRGRNLAVIGAGDLGSAVARLGEALGMRVAVALLAGREHAPCPWPRLPLEELLRWADVLTVHCPLNERTRGLIGAPQLACMRRGALLVNTARGGIVDEKALLEALDSGHLGGAAIDTLEVEPPPPDSPLLAARLPNLIVTPHIAWASREARERLVVQAGEVIAAWRAGQPINRVV